MIHDAGLLLLRRMQPAKISCKRRCLARGYLIVLLAACANCRADLQTISGTSDSARLNDLDAGSDLAGQRAPQDAGSTTPDQTSDSLAGPLIELDCLEETGAFRSTMGGVGQSVARHGSTTLFGIAEAATAVQIIDFPSGMTATALGTVNTNVPPARIGTSSRNDVLGITAHADFAYLATYQGGVVALRIDDARTPTVTSVLDLSAETWAVQHAGAYLYAANHDEGLVVIDIADPGQLRRVASLELEGQTQDIALDGSLAIAASQSHVQVIDVSDPRTPQQLAALSIPGQAYEVWASDERAYIAAKSGRALVSIDLSTPSAPTVLERTPEAPLDFRAIDGIGQRLFVGTGRSNAGSIRVYARDSVQGPAELLSEVALPSEVFEIVAEATYVYAALEDGTLRRFVRTTCP